jgi:hypothetical protein
MALEEPMLNYADLHPGAVQFALYPEIHGDTEREE